MKRLIPTVLLLLAFSASSRSAEPADGINRLLRLPLPVSMDFCGESVPLDREDALERLDLELIVTLGSPVRTTIWFKRIPRYFPIIEEEIAQRGLPSDLKYVALIESDLRATAVSSAGAVGPWQFIRSTARRCGLERTPWRDERRDWVEATRAALDHLSELQEFFGSWALALAAYNSGKNRVKDALESQGETNFYGLRLPRETERYVFRALAAKLVVESPHAYGIELEGARTYPPLETVAVTVDVQRRHLPVAAVAEASGVSYRWLRELNPWIRDDELPRGRHQFEIPALSQGGFEGALARWENQNPEPRTVVYHVRKGDNLTVIARRHNVQLRDLCAWNGLTPRSIIQPGQKLVVQMVN